MTWAKISDNLHSHPKWTGLSPWGKALWVTGLSYVASYDTDGHIARGDFLGQLAVKAFGANPEAFDLLDQATAELVDQGLWETTPAGWVYHDYRAHNPPAEDERTRKRRLERSRELHRTQDGQRVKAGVITRDRNRCRYCGIKVTSRDERPDVAVDEAVATRTFDHVDPDGPNTVDNVVLACARCNRAKGGQALNVVGMRLLPAGSRGARSNARSNSKPRKPAARAGAQTARDDAPAPASTRPARDDSQNARADESRATSPRTRHDGSGRVGSGRVGPGSADGDGAVVDAADRFGFGGVG